MKRIQTALEWLYGAYAWSVFLLGMLIAGSIIILLRKPRYSRPVARCAARSIFLLAGMPVVTQGLARLPDNKPHIVLVNHTSFLDEIALTALLPARPGYAFVARQQYSRQSVFCPFLKALGLVLLRDTDSTRKHSNISLLRLTLKRGDSLVIFPEGRIAPQEGLGHFHSGAFIAAAAENVAIVVAGIHGARDALRLGTWLPRRRTIALKIGPVLMPFGKDDHALARLSAAAREAMLPLTGERDANRSIDP